MTVDGEFKLPIVREHRLWGPTSDGVTTRIEMPESARVLGVEFVGEEIVVRYIEIDEKWIRPRRFWRVETGDPIACSAGTVLRYIGTVTARAFRWHVFEIASGEPEVRS